MQRPLSVRMLPTTNLPRRLRCSASDHRGASRFATKPLTLSLGLALALGLTGRAQAQVSCAAIGADKNAPTVYVAGAATAEPLLRSMAMPLLTASTMPAVIVFQLGGSCAGLSALLAGSDPCQGGGCTSGQATAYLADGTTKQCSVPMATPVDVAVSDVFQSSCAGLPATGLPAVTDRLGPVSAFVMAAPLGTAGSEKAIQAPETHFIFGKGQSAAVLPWTNETTFLIPGPASGAQVLLGLQILVAQDRFKGTLVQSSLSSGQVTLWPENLAQALALADTGIGILPVYTADQHRGEVRRLAFQAIGQRGAFYPDRYSASFEKRNVRDGHYPLWGYLHAVTLKTPAKPLAGTVADLIAGTGQLSDPLPDGGTVTVDLQQLQLEAGLIPQCAMKVARQSDSGPLSPWAPQTSCACWFDQAVPMGSTSCEPCTADPVCGGGHCRRGLCEAR